MKNMSWGSLPVRIMVLIRILPGAVVMAVALASMVGCATVPDDVGALLHGAYPEDGPGAVLIVVQDGRVVYRGAAGMAHLELGVAMRPDHTFKIYSVTKQFTGAAVMLLKEEGKLSLSDPVTHFLPEVALDRSITIEHLIAHTSGLVNYTDLDEWWEVIREPVEGADLVKLFKDLPPRFEPGERWEYNNSGYVLLGLVIERVSGMSYGDFIRTRLLEPLGMASTFVYDVPDALIPNRVSGYTRVEGKWRNAPYFSLTHGFAVGNMLSTVDDLARWDAAIRHSEILSADGWQAALTSFRMSDGADTRYAAGRYVGRLGPFATLEHGGNLAGGMTHVMRVPEADLFVAVLANAEPPPAVVPEDLAIEVAASLLGVDPSPQEIQLPVSRLTEYVGVYRIDAHNTRKVFLQDDAIFSRHSSGEPLLIYPIGDDLFAFEGSHTWLRFEREGGRVTAMRLLPRLEPESPRAHRER